METKTLEEIGLTKSEAKVYLALAEIGTSTTGKIAQKAGVASSKIYDILDKLQKKGLVSHVIRTGVREFEAAPPERIMMYLEEKESALKLEKQKAQKLIEQLKVKSTLVKAQDATIYRGMKGLKSVFYQCTDEMKSGEEILALGVPYRTDNVDKFFVRWNKFRENKKIRFRILFNENARGQRQALPEESSPLSEIRFMPEGVITPAAINVFNDKVIIFPAESGEDPLLILIRSKEIAESFRAQFNLLWNHNVKTFYGLEGPRFVIKDIMKDKKSNFAFGLAHEKLEKNVPNELKELIAYENTNKLITKLIYTGKRKFPTGKYVETRYMPKKFATPFHYELYGNKIAIFYWTDPIITTVIENHQIAENFKKHFDKMWKMAKKSL
jgi:sugar-specific transcriptional regulator TrmB